MIGETVDIIGTAFLFLAPFVLALIVIVLVVAYPWLLLIPLVLWLLYVKYVPEANAPETQGDFGQSVHAPAARHQGAASSSSTSPTRTSNTEGEEPGAQSIGEQEATT